MKSFVLHLNLQSQAKLLIQSFCFLDLLISLNKDQIAVLLCLDAHAFKAYGSQSVHHSVILYVCNSVL